MSTLRSDLTDMSMGMETLLMDLEALWLMPISLNLEEICILTTVSTGVFNHSRCITLLFSIMIHDFFLRALI